MSRDIRVEIYGHLYTIRTDLDPSYIEKLAAMVDARMAALSGQADIADTRRLAVLAAMNLADELHELQKSLEVERYTLPPDFLARLEQCHRLLDEVLGAEAA